MNNSNVNTNFGKLPFETPHYSSNSEVVNGVPSFVNFNDYSDVDLTPFCLFPQIERFHYSDIMEEYVGNVMYPWAGVITQEQMYDVQNRFSSFGSMNRTSLHLIANDVYLKQTAEECLQCTDIAIDSLINSSDYTGAITYVLVTPNSNGTVEIRDIHNLQTEEDYLRLEYGNDFYDAIFGDVEIPSNFWANEWSGTAKYNNPIFKPNNGNSYTAEIVVDLNKPLLSGKKYLFTVNAEWGFTQFSKRTGPLSGYRNRVGYTHAMVSVNPKRPDGSVDSSSKFSDFGAIAMCASYNTQYYHKYHSHTGHRYRYAHVGSGAPGNQDGIFQGKKVITFGSDSYLNGATTLRLNVNIEYGGKFFFNGVPSSTDVPVVGVKSLYILIESI